MFRQLPIIAVSIGLLSRANAQAPNVSQVLMWSTVTNTNVGPGASQSLRPDFIPTISGVLPRALLSVYKVDVFENYLQPGKYSTANLSALNSAISSNVGLSLALIPVSSPASAVISKIDPSTGAPVAAS